MNAAATPREAAAPNPRIALIHATPLAIEPIVEAFRLGWPEAGLFNLLDDSLPKDRTRRPDGTAPLSERFVALSRYAQAAGAAAILYTCSAFGPEIDAARRAVALPTLKPNEAMFTDALDAGTRIALLATFEPSIAPMQDELVALAAARGVPLDLGVAFVPGAYAALQCGDGDGHDAAIAAAATRLADREVVLLAQFSMARAQRRVADAVAATVLTSPASAVRALRAALQPPER